MKVAQYGDFTSAILRYFNVSMIIIFIYEKISS